LSCVPAAQASFYSNSSFSETFFHSFVVHEAVSLEASSLNWAISNRPSRTEIMVAFWRAQSSPVAARLLRGLGNSRFSPTAKRRCSSSSGGDGRTLRSQVSSTWQRPRFGPTSGTSSQSLACATGCRRLSWPTKVVSSDRVRDGLSRDAAFELDLSTPP
jgi:hypothetical protein